MADRSDLTVVTESAEDAVAERTRCADIDRRVTRLEDQSAAIREGLADLKSLVHRTSDDIGMLRSDMAGMSERMVREIGSVQVDLIGLSERASREIGEMRRELAERTADLPRRSDLRSHGFGIAGLCAAVAALVLATIALLVALR